MRGTPPTPEELARWLLSSGGGTQDTSEEYLMAAIQIYEQLRTHLATFLGMQGVDALWVRAVHLVQRNIPYEGIGGASPSRHRLDLLVHGRNTADAHKTLVAVFSQFLTLLFTFIGVDLGFRLLRQHWLTMPLLTASEHERGEEAHQ